jgi:filamentous hemagglutinin
MKLKYPHTVRHSRTLIAQAVTAALTYSQVGAAAPPPQLPIPCFAGTCAPGTTPGFSTKLPNGTPTGPTGFVTSGSATATQSGNSLTVTQTSNQAILNWASFNIGAGGTVQFNQPGSTSVALNKIYQNSPSSIFGALNANGQVYLINPNGFVFGSSATVNVAGLMASSLGLFGGDTQFASSGLIPSVGSHLPALSSDGRTYVSDATGKPILDANGQPQQVQIQVQQGASITAADGGRVMLAGQVVDNSGSISAPDGQVVLAAGQSVYLQSSSDPSLRGLVVEVNNVILNPSTGQPLPPQTGAAPAVPVGTVTNEADAALSAPRGNVSLLGLAVNQSGRISASTSVSANGSVILQAAEGAAPGSSTSALDLEATQGGTLTIAPTSDIEILPELADATTAAVAQPQTPSSIQLTGEAVFVNGGTINAPGGDLNVIAAAAPGLGLQTEGNQAAQIRVASGTTINLAGSTAQLPMSSNIVAVQLFSNELEDDPQQRDSALHGQTVYVDTRDGRPPIISDSSWQAILQGVQEDVAQRTAAGGSANFQSEGDVVLAKGASINVSGGAWNYSAGAAQTSQLIGANGQTYSIETADPTLQYTGVLNPTYTQTFNGFGVQLTGSTPGLGHTDSAYTQGFSAGSISIAAPAMVMQATLVGTAVNGAYQRNPASIPAESLAAVVANGGTVPASGAVAMASGGTLRIGDPTAPGAADGLPYFYAPAVSFSANPAPVSIADGAPLPPQPLQLGTDYLTNGGFQQTQIFSDSQVTLPAGLALNLGAGGSLLVLAPRITVGSSIQAIGGSINLESVQSQDALSSDQRLGINIGSGVTFDVSGQWTNDSDLAQADPQGATWQNGGSIVLSLTLNPNWLPSGLWPSSSEASTISGYTALSPGGELSLGNGVSLLADGGAWLNSGTKVTGGTGGSIDIAAGSYQAGLQVGNGVSLAAFGVQGASGGSFTLQAPRLLVQSGSSWSGAQSIDDLNSPGGVFDVGSALYSADGFSKVNLTATGLPQIGAANADVLTVATGTAIDARAQSLQLTGSYLTHPTGGDVLNFTQPELLPIASQTPSSLSFQSLIANSYIGSRTDMGDVDVQQGASIGVSPGAGGAISLASQGSILIDGSLQAQGGNISAHITVPTTLQDPGYVRDQDIVLGPQAVLDVSGTLVSSPNTLNLPLGSVLPGGTVTLTADRGGIVADGPAADCSPAGDCGSVIDIAGASAQVAQTNTGPAGGYTLTEVGSAGGALVLTSSESVSLLGTLYASAGEGAPAEGAIEGGSLTLDLRPALPSSNPFQTPPYSAPYAIQLVQSVAGTTAAPDFSGDAALGITQLEQSGIDSLTLSAGGSSDSASSTIASSISINAGGQVALSMGRQITLDAPIIAINNATQATITAPYVTLTDTQIVPPSRAVQTTGATTGSGSLTVNAQEIALSGYTWVQGANNVTLNSVNDVQLQPLTAVQFGGALNVAGNLNISAARVFPATLADYTINAGGNLTIASQAAAPATPVIPFSVGGTLVMNATNITNDGSVLAPFGDISLNATNQLVLGPGSYTSVSANGALLPFGTTTYGQEEWIYSSGAATEPVSGIGSLTSVLGGSTGATGSRTLTLSGQNVQLQDGATVNVSGGGDISAYEWVPGLGGSVDSLNPTLARAAGLYAIIPASGPFAAYDLQEFPSSGISAGESIYLSGTSGLPAGFYALLPARYALLPGAWLIQAEPSYQSLAPGTLGTLADGTAVVAGYMTFGNGSSGLGAGNATQGVRAASGYSGFAVLPGSYAQQLAQYTMTTGSAYFGALAAQATEAGEPQVAVPGDAGTLALAVGRSLTLANGSTVNTSASSGGVVGTVEIYSGGATSGGTASPSSGSGNIYVGDASLAPSGDVVVNPVAVQSWSAGNLLLGGDLQANNSINVTAGTVEFGAGSTLTAGQVVAVANSAIDVDSGAQISTSGSAGSPALETISLTSNGAADNKAALLAVSNASLPIVQRTATIGVGAATVSIDNGSLNTNGAVSLDAPGGVTVTDGSTFGAPGASVSLASNSVGFVGPGAASTDTLQIDPAMLAQLNQAGAVRITSAGAIDLMTPVTLGGGTPAAPTMQSLTLVASALNDQAPSSTFTANTISIQGNGSASPAHAVSPSGALASQSLTFAGNQIDFGGQIPLGSAAASAAPSGGAGTLAINNYGQTATTTMTATGAIVGEGSGTVAVNGGNLILQAAEVTASGGSAATLLVPAGNVRIQQQGSADAPSSLAASLGGGITLTAQSIADSGSIIVPGGRISLQTTAGDLNVNSGADIDASGIAVGVMNQTSGAAGGIVTLGSAGNLLLAPGSTINVAGALGSPDGFLNLTAAGNATLGSSLKGGAQGDVDGGSFSLYAAGSLTGGLQGLAGSLAGFTQAISIEVGKGDLDLTGGQQLTANQVVLSADSGAIDIAGTINAPSADTRGSIGLFAQNDVTLESGGTLNASATTTNDDSSGRGGDIELSTVSGAINLPASASSTNGIITAGPQQAGTLLLRAPSMNGDDVQISQIDTNLRGVGQITVEPVLQAADYVQYGTGGVPTGDITTETNIDNITSTVNGYFQAASGLIPARLQPQSAPGSQGTFPALLIEPGVVINETAATTSLTQSLDLTSQTSPLDYSLLTPIDLTVRATGSLNIYGSITDGSYIQGDGTAGLIGTTGLPGPSSSLRFVAGANLASANPLGVMPGAAATLTLGFSNSKAGQGTILQTGTGDIDLVSSGNIVINPFSSAATLGETPLTGDQIHSLGDAGNLTYMTGGGNVNVSAGGSITATNVQENISAWLGFDAVPGNGIEVGLWGVNLDAFAINPWSVASLGGGDVRVSAVGNITTMAAAAAGAMDATGSAQIPYASGGLDVHAGGNITAGQFFLSDGTATLNAGQAFATAPLTIVGLAQPAQVGSLFALQKSRMSLWAEDGITISGVVNPTTLPQPLADSQAEFLSYGQTSGLSAQTSAGSVVVNDNSIVLPFFVGKLPGGQLVNTEASFSLFPGSLKLVSLSQDVNDSATNATLAPSPNGQLNLLAAQDIDGGEIFMSDAPLTAIPTVTDVGAANRSGGLLLSLAGSTSTFDFDGDLHAGSIIPASVVAGRDIENLTMSLPESADIEAGRDIVDLQYKGENLSADGLTLIYAGRDITYPLGYNASGLATSSPLTISVGGPGSLDLIAGRNINLGFDGGVITTGNIGNANLAPGGASISMAVGLGQQPDYNAVLTQIIEPSATYQQELVSYVESLTGQTGLSATQANAEFSGNADSSAPASLTDSQRNAFIYQVFFGELNLSGIEATSVKGAGYQRGYNAIATLFPGSPTAIGQTAANAFSGDLDLIYSQIDTESGGNISLLVPGGDINVGVANAPAGGTVKSPNQLGIVTASGGNVDIYSLGDVNVNSSRIFALGGGDILIWSQLGSIDAGNGAKSSLSLPPPTISYDQYGNPYVAFNAAVAGSGIRTIQTGVGQDAGSVNLIAPVGTVNAGDAGIGAAGDINIAAASVVGAANINFGGTATGVPAVVSDITASVSSAASAASSATTSASSSLDQANSNKADQAPLAQAALSWLDVFVTGMGEENCKPEDTECLKRQTHQ